MCNHVSFSDFVIDPLFLEDPVLVSRAKAWYAFLPAAIGISLLDVAMFFQRYRKGDRQRLYDGVVARWEAGRTIIVYPEGRRNPAGKRLPLKVGLIKLAYERGIPVMVSLTSNKESVFSERALRASFGVAVHNYQSPIVEPRRCKDLAAFIEAVQRQWDGVWEKVALCERRQAGGVGAGVGAGEIGSGGEGRRKVRVEGY